MPADQLREFGGGTQDEVVLADRAPYHTSAGLHVLIDHARINVMSLVNPSAVKAVLSFRLHWILIFFGPLFLRGRDDII